MSRILTLIFAAAFLSTPAAAADRYEFDHSHTRILFFVNHLGFSDMVGEFTDYDGHFTFDPKKPGESTVDVTLKPSGIRTSSAKLDEHLQGEDFFNSAKFPEIRFKSTAVKVTGERTGEITGDLTMLGVTKPVVMQVRLNKADFRPMGQDFVAGFSAGASVKRSDFGMNYSIPLVGDEVRLMVETEGVNVDLKETSEPGR